MSSETQSLWTMAVAHWQTTRPLLPMYTHLILSAIFPIYTGAYASLSRPASAADRSRTKNASREEDDDDEEEEEVVQKMEGLTASDAIIFPITAGLMLAGLYFLITRYGARVINLILSWYFAAIGIYSVGKFINDAINVSITLIFPNYYSSKGMLYKVDARRRRARAIAKNAPAIDLAAPSPLYQGKVLSRVGWTLRRTLKQKYSLKMFVHSLLDVQANLTAINAISALLGLLSIIYANFGGKPWWLTNLQGFAVCYSAMQLMSPTTFATGSLILSALFFYDIWAVFFTPLMVTVATNLDQPIKLLFPKPDEPDSKAGEPPLKSYSMLGLGDIVLPGLMIGLALRFDLYMHYLKKQKDVKSRDEKSKANEDSVQKAEYVPVTGRWGDYLWTIGMKKSSLPDSFHLTFAKPYFIMSLVGYLIGMLTTLMVMTVFQHAQPALLYLVPGVLTSIWSTALVRGELSQMWEFSEAITGEQIDEDKEVAPGKEEKSEPKVKDAKDTPSDSKWWQTLWSSLVGSDSNATKSVQERADTKKKHEKESALKGQRNGVVLAFSLSQLDITKHTSEKPYKTETRTETSKSTQLEIVDTSNLVSRSVTSSKT